jgi:DNA-binding beta-propeller fold protein YncE
VAVDRHGRIYVADTQRNAVSVLSSAGSLLQRWTGPLKAPTAIAVDRSGNVYVGDRTALTEFSPTGRIIKRMQAPVTGLATGDGGSVFLAAHLPSITEINGKGRTAAVYSMGAGAADAVAVGVRGTRYVLDTSAGRLSVMDSSGTLVQALGGRRTRPGGLSSPRALAAGAGGRVFVADTGNNRIVVFAPAPYVR